jgi:hypothetical protein
MGTCHSWPQFSGTDQISPHFSIPCYGSVHILSYVGHTEKIVCFVLICINDYVFTDLSLAEYLLFCLFAINRQ